ncbi:hypothetical protein A2767_06035 [Candidatus Roizmanbacteria bacterium RIFCSPHIGHO2_01_FULL_35_10]|nr:MAG: hypothetical protein A2767_06035 [Candidatus Roizmanbacteria bacterium RIFCSPHIGHO2_01_FULL_35_10]
MLLTNTPIAATTSTQTQCNPGEISLNDALSGSTVCSPITPAPGSLSDVLEGGPMDGGPDNNPFTSDTLPTIIP